MSLLLEALKKAELAKQAAKEGQPAADAPPPFTRDKLPDISQPMEIHSEDLSLVDSEPAPKPAGKRELELAPEEPPRVLSPEPAPRPPPPPPRAAPMEEPEFTAPIEAEERKQAQQMFEAKELDVNPRKPFYITVGALGLFALGTVGYFWYELQPKNNYNIPPPSAQPAAPPVAAAPEPAAPVASTVTPPTGVQPTMPAPVASAPVEAAPAPPAPAAAAPAPAAVVARKSDAPLARRTAPASAVADQAPAPPRGSDIKITPARVETDPVLTSAYQAFNAGDLARAHDDYQRVLQASPDNRDALLGMAAVKIQDGQYEAAASFYTRLLELDPRDAHAHAGLIGLKGQIDPLAAESRLKNMIAAQPEASFLHFTLGNQYAAQSRWAEAQQSYFRAYSGDPGHPDFAYNLAVSLDKLHQGKPALEYYRLALKLAANHPVSFDKAQVDKRVSQLAH